MSWEETFAPVNMKNCGCFNDRKQGEVKNSDKYITLDISLDFGIMDKMKIKYSEVKDYLERSGK